MFRCVFNLIITTACFAIVAPMCIAEEETLIKLNPQLLLREPLQKELNMTAEQISRVKTLPDLFGTNSTKDYSQEIQDQLAKAWQNNDQRQISRLNAEGQKQAREKRIEKLQPRIPEILNPEQVNRFREVTVQFDGLIHPDIRKALKFTDEQEKKSEAFVKEMTEKSSIRASERSYQGRFSFPSQNVIDALELTPAQQKKLKELQQEAAIEAPFAISITAREKLRQDTRKQIEALMTKEQKESFEVLKGKEFDVDQLSSIREMQRRRQARQAAEK